MKGKFDAYVLWPLAKIVQNWIVDRSTAHNFMVFNFVPYCTKREFQVVKNRSHKKVHNFPILPQLLKGLQFDSKSHENNSIHFFTHFTNEIWEDGKEDLSIHNLTSENVWICHAWIWNCLRLRWCKLC